MANVWFQRRGLAGSCFRTLNDRFGALSFGGTVENGS
jgi:hypothetical protein